ncbi:MAG: ABC transporter ATP-binding protein [Planctomycetes bacterium]|nr:ABC transporter ATP-binding protein [Planctomycetota bacterium]
MSAAAILVTDLGKAFGPRQVLRGVDLRVARGELLGLVGPNGAGKSTLLRTLLGLTAPTRGRVDVLGHDPARDSLAIRRRVSYLPGETGVYLQMTGAQFLRFAAGFYPRQQAGLQARLLDGFQLPLQQRVRSYSAGMKQKLALVAVLCPDVDLYLLDEPDRALDASVRFFLRDVLLTLKRAGKTIVLSSHHLGEVETLADRLEFLLDGVFVPSERLTHARAQLRQRPRVRLHRGAALPPGAREVQREPDGTLVIETDADPMAWLRSVPDGTVDSAEIGIPRLEDLYQLLLQHDRRDGGVG